MRLRSPAAAALVVTFLLSPAWAQRTRSAAVKAPPGPIAIELDARQTPQKILHAKLTFAVTAGPLALLYPKWIPGEHGPTGPLLGLTGLKFFAGGKEIPWRRDDVEMYEFHVNVPPGATSLEATFDYVEPVEGESGSYTSGSSATGKMVVLSWNQVLLYPAGVAIEDLQYAPMLQLPPGWKFGTALPLGNSMPAADKFTGNGEPIVFAPASLYTLVDSPILAGEYYRAIPLSPAGSTRPVELDMGADSAAVLDLPAAEQSHYKRLVTEAQALFGGEHYRDYHFLFSLSDHVAHFGLEHHESNDSRVPERTLLDDGERRRSAGLLPHEYVHSWNGKYRRPDGLATPDYEAPMKGELLWVYEGLTEYLGDVLTARSGLWSDADYRDSLAGTAAEMAHTSGRQWRNLQDTAVDVSTLNDAPNQWSNWRRGLDYYPEGELIWLDVDTTIRELTHGQKSLDDFCKLFFGPPQNPDNPPNAAPHFKAYTFDDLVNALNQVAANDWRKFLRDRVDYTGANAPLGGLEHSGWKLVYSEEASPMMRSRSGAANLTYSLGMTVGSDGRVADVEFSAPAATAGISPGMKIVAVNGRAYTAEIIHDALKAAKGNSEPIQLLVENNDYFKTYAVNYHDGDRYPHLVRNEGQPDVLGEIIKGRAPEK